MEEELFITLSRPRPAPLIQLQFRDWLHEVMDAAELVAIAERIVACRDARDDKFLELSIRLSTLLVKFRSPKPAADAPASPAPALAPAPRARTMHPIVERLHHMGVQAQLCGFGMGRERSRDLRPLFRGIGRPMARRW